MKKYCYSLIFTSALLGMLFSACDEGLSPYEVQPLTLEFPIEPLGGNPTGTWLPDSIDPILITILDASQIPAVVDSMRITSELDGSFSFEITGDCHVEALLTIKPTIYLIGSPNPLSLTLTDTIKGEGSFYLIEDRVLQTPIQSMNFDLDTLGFTNIQDNLELISPPTIFNYMGLVEIPVFLAFRLIRDTGSNLAFAQKSVMLYRKQEDGRWKHIKPVSSSH